MGKPKNAKETRLVAQNLLDKKKKATRKHYKLFVKKTKEEVWLNAECGWNEENDEQTRVLLDFEAMKKSKARELKEHEAEYVLAVAGLATDSDDDDPDFNPKH
jgi:CRISPR/Cas system CMR-associated protein Cmr1 (group 7 of RAMP superfamily)